MDNETNAVVPEAGTAEPTAEQLLREGPRQPFQTFQPFRGLNASDKKQTDDTSSEDTPPDTGAADADKHVEQQPDAAAQDGYALDVSPLVPQQFYEATAADIAQAGVLAKELGVPQAEIQRVADYAVSLAVSDESGVDLANQDACLHVLMSRYGNDEGRKIVEAAQRAVVRLGPKAAAFLDAGGLGNSPAVLAALAAYERGDLRMSPEQARAELDKLTKGDRRSAYFNANDKGHKAAVDRSNLLYMFAYPDGAEDAAPTSEAKKETTSPELAKLDEDIKLAIHDPAYLDANHPKHRDAVDRATALYERRYRD